ncbi:hypothetical protein BDV11DRAFT_206106 [Aspergillus similis]
MALTLSRRAVGCEYTTPSSAGDTCSRFASSWRLSVDTLQHLDPGISCLSLDTNQSYCVIDTVTEDTEEPSTSTTLVTTTTITTTTTSTSPSNSPTIPGIADNSDIFYKVSSGGQCGTIAASHGITVEQLNSWNNCTNLWLRYYICVHVAGVQPPLNQPPTGPLRANFPNPGVADNFDDFYQVSLGDHDQLRSWNSEINADCTNLWPDYYICPTNPEPTDEPSGPTPQMPGIVDNCKSSHLIQSGNSSWSIYTDAGITFEQFRRWNAQVDAACNNLNNPTG